jgi:hypothetical protein
MPVSKILAAASLMLVVSEAGMAQSLASRMSAVRDGKVRMTFASRDDICGFNNGISTRSDRNDNRSNWGGSRNEDVEYDVECSEGPARVVVEKSGGRITKIRAYVGGRWRAGSSATDLGSVGAREAVDWLMNVASGQPDKISGSAIFAATLADSVQIARRLYDFARNDSNPRESRDQAIFWLGQTGDESAPMLRSLYTQVGNESLKDKVIFSLSQQRGVNDQWLLDLVANRNESIEMRKKALFWAGQTGASMAELGRIYSRSDEREMKDQMIFVFSQRREPAALDKLMDIARHDPDREARKKAMFWLGQSKDPRVVGMLTDILNR